MRPEHAQLRVCRLFAILYCSKPVYTIVLVLTSTRDPLHPYIHHNAPLCLCG